MNRVLRRAHLAVLIAIGMQAGCVAKSRAPSDPVPLSELASQISAAAQERPLVIVGESSHGVEEFGRLKLELVRELHRRGHARLILLESPFAGSFGVSPLDSTRTATEYLNSTTYAVWHTRAYSELVQYLRAQAAMGDTIHWVCIDPNPLLSAAHLPLSEMLGSTFTVNSDSGRALVRLVPLIDELHLIETSGSTSPVEIARARSIVDQGRRQIAAALQAQSSDSVRVGIAVSRALFDSFEMWTSSAQDSTPAAKMLLRDRRMTRMVELARNELHPGSPTVLLTHNWHARRHAERVTAEKIPGVHGITDDMYSRAGATDREFISLGGRLTRTQPESTFVVGLYFGEGTVALNDRSTAIIPAARAGSLEHRVLDRFSGGGILNFTRRGLMLTTPWWRTEQSARYSGLWEERLVPSEQYDCIVVIPRATPPRYTD